MAITTPEFEQQLTDLLTKMQDWQRCKWCGCNEHQRRIEDRSEMCNSCKTWDRRERRAEDWIRENSDNAGVEQNMRVEYNIEYAALCREEGQIGSWKGPITPLKLEWELQSISERFCGEDVFGHTILYFEQFSEAQRRLLMFLFEELTKVWIRHRRQSFATDRVMRKHFPTRGPS
jgi:hypothetical protein